MDRPMMSLVGAALLFLVLFPLPLKIAASMVGARRTGLLACLVAIFFGAVLSFAVVEVVPQGWMALLGVFIALSVAYWIVLQPSLPGAFALSILAALVQFIIVCALWYFGALSLTELQHVTTPPGGTLL